MQYHFNGLYNVLYKSKNALKYYHQQKVHNRANLLNEILEHTTRRASDSPSGVLKFFMNGAIFNMLLGGWNLDEIKTTALPQKVQSAFTAVTGELVGADYEPIAYLGSQVVNGTNYRVLCLQKLVVPNAEKRIVKMIIHEELDGSVSLSSVSGVAL